MTNEEYSTYTQKSGKIIAWISRYVIFYNGKPQINGIKGWRNALRIANKMKGGDLFNEEKDLKQTIEILNLWTGEIVSLEEANKRAKKIGFYEAVNSGTDDRNCIVKTLKSV